jgi:hypothetical protein
VLGSDVDSPKGFRKSCERPEVTRVNMSCAALNGAPDSSNPFTKSMKSDPVFSANELIDHGTYYKSRSSLPGR